MAIIYELDLSSFHGVVSDESLIKTKKIRKLSVTKQITRLPIGAFSHCKNLKKVYFEPKSGLLSLPEYVFSECISLVKINDLPDNLVSIENYAFKNCVNLKSIIIPKSVIFIGEHAFDGWKDDQIIYVYQDVVFDSSCNAQVVNLSNQANQSQVDHDIYSEDGKKFFMVTAKCGHVGRPHYIPIDFPIKTVDAKEAAEVVRKFGRVKHNHKDAILKVQEVSKRDYLNQKKKNNEDPYLKSNSKHEQSEFHELIRHRFVKDPHYVPKKNKKNVILKKSDLSSEYKKQKIDKELIKH